MAGLNIGAAVAAALQPVVAEAMTQAVYLAEDDLVPQIIAATADATMRTARTVVTFGELLRQGASEVGPKLEAANTELARGAQEATIAAYQAARDAGRHSPAYRTSARDPRNTRYAGGLLLGALASGGFATATDKGILFGNVPLLDGAARQWARLNFGAGAAAGAGSPRFNVHWSNLVVASMGLEEAARPPFRIPRGFWINREEFYPLGELPSGFSRGGGVVENQEPRMTRGIRAEHWLDAGVGYIAENLGETYRNVYKQIYREAAGAVREAGGVTLTRPGRPGTSVGIE
jgi:hypothetical protein